MIRYLLSIVILSSFFQQSVAASEVSLLQAIHVAEIHTTRTPSGHHNGTYNGVPHYVIEVPVDNEIKRVWVHKSNGRVSKIESGDEQAPTLEYQWPGIKVVAHRGGVGLDVPENTLPAIQKAIDIGAQLVEIDVRETKDGHLILMHDATVDRTTNGSGRVEDMTLKEIRELDAGGWHAVTEENIRLIHLLGAQAFVNTLDTADTLLNVELAAEAGADYIQTDYPDKVIALLREKGLMYDGKKDVGGRIHPLGNERLRYPLR